MSRFSRYLKGKKQSVISSLLRRFHPLLVLCSLRLLCSPKFWSPLKMYILFGISTFQKSYYRECDEPLQLSLSEPKLETVPWISTTIVLLLILSCLFWARIMLMNPRPLSLVMLIFYYPLTFAKSNTPAPIWNFLSWWIPSPPTQPLNPQTCWFFLLFLYPSNGLW